MSSGQLIKVSNKINQWIGELVQMTKRKIILNWQERDKNRRSNRQLTIEIQTRIEITRRKGTNLKCSLSTVILSVWGHNHRTEPPYYINLRLTSGHSLTGDDVGRCCSGWYGWERKYCDEILSILVRSLSIVTWPLDTACQVSLGLCYWTYPRIRSEDSVCSGLVHRHVRLGYLPPEPLHCLPHTKDRPSTWLRWWRSRSPDPFYPGVSTFHQTLAWI